MHKMDKIDLWLGVAILVAILVLIAPLGVTCLILLYAIQWELLQSMFLWMFP